ncbi:serglycin isoform X1 [Maylandia zebra]|uniref:serglycin isoform X1 n=1 Tax=Maylandia zebra TaxID=106582 RepID=UPI000647CB34|nr:serglycin isoform X1 [Maylandia zebra]
MKLILLLLISCLALHSTKGAPRTAVYKFMRCNPDGDQANCVTQQSPEMEWNPDLPSKLPASAAEYLEAEPVEDENSPMEEDDEEEQEYEEEAEEEESKLSESPGIFLGEEGSGGYEGSAAEGPYMADKSNLGETGSGMLWKESEDMSDLRRLFASRRTSDEVKPDERDYKEDHLLQL